MQTSLVSALNSTACSQPVWMEALEERKFLSASGIGHGSFFSEADLVTNPGSGINAAHTDANLKNAWGLAAGPNTFFWVANNGTSTSTVYDAQGVAQPGGSPLVVSVPGADGQDGTGLPTGLVFNGNGGFEVSRNGKTGSSTFIFAGEDGVISGWNPQVDQAHAVIALNDSDEGAIYKGAALGNMGGQTFLYVADFHNGEIGVYNSHFGEVQMPNAFKDSKLPAGFAPFNVANVDGKLYVTYAKQDADKEDDVAGAGNGFVDVFNTSGHLLQRLETGRFMNSPWGVTVAPKGYGRFGDDILIGQFGSGQIAAFNRHSGKFHGLLHDRTGQRVTIDGLWSLSFGNNRMAGDAHTLYFTAGPNDEADGLFGSLAIHNGHGHNK